MISEKSQLRIKEEWKNKDGLYDCPYCEKSYVKRGISTHIWRNHSAQGQEFNKNSINNQGYANGTRTAWNKGLTKEMHPSLKKAGETYKKKIASGEIIVKSIPLSELHKEKISNGMKSAHAEGRAWNIGRSRWNNEPSWPEKFFKQVIENEFDNKKFKMEYPVSIYSCDFAWPEIKKCIEIDGAQHQRFDEVKERDKRKDECLKENGWEVLRIPWKDFYKNTKKSIKLSNEFIGE